ncbi:hypothetical protein GUJ93_ZPchr0006g44119 [Zizania palustris]|uniref:Uncharacterized protein n=1 Tax=Zizania palustris TaxID=103762 RepID=A0A8J5VW55_ZIZPA|nr:hypothetical protein GUJ93_ZPchr0006g44119 [Zizania palustris]
MPRRNAPPPAQNSRSATIPPLPSTLPSTVACFSRSRLYPVEAPRLPPALTARGARPATASRIPLPLIRNAGASLRVRCRCVAVLSIGCPRTVGAHQVFDEIGYSGLLRSN